jgi:arylsulfatase A-like enzyme
MVSKSFLVAVAVCGFAASAAVPAHGRPEQPPNVLFIVMDDMRPELGCYGRDHVVSPHIDRLGSQGMVFRRAYTQLSLCNPSRASVMTGLRPDSTGVHDLLTHFRTKVPDVVTLPQHFRVNGYHTLAFGKIYHPAFHGKAIGSDLGDPDSWSEPIWMGEPRYYYSPLGEKLTREVYAKKTGKTGAELEEWKTDFLRSLATEAPDVPDEALYDGQVTERSIEALRRLAPRARGDDGVRQPFFLAAGFLKPHLPFIAPKRYWDLYDPTKLELTHLRRPPVDVPAPAIDVVLDELRQSYPWDVRVDPATGQPVSEFAVYDMPSKGELLPEQERRLLHGYYACVSFVDAQVGKMVAALEELDLAKDTIVVVWGDHGFHLGELSLWSKFTNFEVGTLSPLIVYDPRVRPSQNETDALVELVDIYPGLVELAGLPVPSHLEGTSFAPLLADPGRRWKEAAFSQYPRRDLMGYSVRTDRYRYTEWRQDAGRGEVVGVELYDHAVDPDESVNRAGGPDYRVTRERLANVLRDGWRALPPPHAPSLGSANP